MLHRHTIYKLTKYLTYIVLFESKKNFIQLTYIPFRIGLNLTLIVLKSGRSSGFSAQQSSKQSLTKSKLFSSNSNGGLYTNEKLSFINVYELV